MTITYKCKKCDFEMRFAKLDNKAIIELPCPNCGNKLRKITEAKTK